LGKPASTARTIAHGIAVDVFEPAEGERGQVRSCPGSKILGGDLLAGDLAQICIDLA
jgi:hypothetical protein